MCIPPAPSLLAFLSGTFIAIVDTDAETEFKVRAEFFAFYLQFFGGESEFVIGFLLDFVSDDDDILVWDEPCAAGVLVQRARQDVLCLIV